MSPFYGSLCRSLIQSKLDYGWMFLLKMLSEPCTLIMSWCLSNLSIFQPMCTELAVIRRSKEKNFIIFSDSMSSQEALSGFKMKYRYCAKYYQILHSSG